MLAKYRFSMWMSQSILPKRKVNREQRWDSPNVTGVYNVKVEETAADPLYFLRPCRVREVENAVEIIEKKRGEEKVELELEIEW